MDLHSTPVAAVAFLLLVGAGAVWDVGTRRIPNLLVAITAAGGLAWQAVVHDGVTALLAVACGIGVVVALWVPW